MADFKIDFAGIGVAKSGTSWIARCLNEHPQVCMALGKETNFFVTKGFGATLPRKIRYYGTSHFHEGIAWYKALFTHHQPGQLLGEYTVAYLGDPETARMLHEHNPGLKILCCFRNPVDVVYAGYHQMSRVQPLPDTLEEALKQYPHFLEYARYHKNLQPFLARFPRENFHLMFFEDIKADPAAFFRRICEFLKIDPTFTPPSLHQKVNQRTVLRSVRLRNLRCALGEFMGSNAFMRFIRKGLIKTGIAARVVKLFRMNEKPGVSPPMKPETRRMLVEYFRKDNAALSEFVGRDLSAWNHVAD